jgi:hypothetical protein
MKIEAPKHAALFMDCSTNNFRARAYINYKLHFCTKDFKLVVLTLKTALFHHPHTAVRLKKDIEDNIAEFGLQDKKLMAVTDSDAKILVDCDWRIYHASLVWPTTYIC